MKTSTKFQWEGADRLELLVTADQAYPALEELVFKAQSEVLLGFRVFDPDTRLSSDSVSQDLKTWGDLIALKVRQEITVRLLLTDFEPLLTTQLHAQSWKAVRTFIEKCAGQDRFEVICAQHEAQFSPVMRWVFWPMFLKKLFQRRTEARQNQLDLKTTPGLRPYLSLGGKLATRRLVKPAPMHPATYHQKVAVVDGKHAIVGGLDVDERCFDTYDHKQRASETWHDVSVLVHGDVAADLRQHFAQCWALERARPQNQLRLQQLCRDNGLEAPPSSSLPNQVTAKARNRAATTRVIATVSRNADKFLSLSPSPDCEDIYEEIQTIVQAAHSVIYVETQFFRSRRLAKMMARRALAEPNLQCILLLPFAPEEIAFDKHDHPAHRHGEWLQGRCLKILKKAFWERLGVFSLAKPQLSTQETGRAKAYNAGVIHLHSKVLMVDDEVGTITSANLNERSLKWDTEVGVVIRDADFIKQSRQRLWQRHLATSDASQWGLEDGLGHWKECAFSNVKTAPQRRQGFVLPHSSARTIRYGRPAIFIPDEMV